MPWSSIATTDVENEILPDEQTLLAAIQGSSGVLAAILPVVVNQVRSQILVGGNQLDAAGTVPDQLRSEVIAIARWRWFTSLPNTDLCSKQRESQYNNAVETLKDVMSGKDKSGRVVKVELPNPATALTSLTGPAGQMQGGNSRGTRRTKAIGGLI